jgi:hypothetical protein
MLYPLVYSIVTLPVAVCRIGTMAGWTPPFPLYIFAGVSKVLPTQRRYTNLVRSQMAFTSSGKRLTKNTFCTPLTYLR